MCSRPFRKTQIPTPVGTLWAVADDQGLRELRWPHSEKALEDAEAREVLPDADPILSRLAIQIEEYFAGVRQTFDLPLAPIGTPFQRAAWKALRTIPYGQTRSYSEQALQMGQPDAVRAVGGANRKNPISIVIPCHRVIGKDGSLTGYGGGIEVKRFLLELEDRVLKNGTAN